MNEKRQHARFPTKLRVWCEGDNITLFSRVGNLGVGGMFVHTGTPFAQGARARVRLKDEASGGEVRAHATVVWSRRLGSGLPAGMGLKFETGDDGLVEQIRRLLLAEHGNQPGLR